jgi:hypothetical protein
MSSLVETEKTDADFCQFAGRKSALTDQSTLVDSSISFPVETSTFLDGEVFLRRTTRSAHDRATLFDDLPRVGVAVLVALRSSARIVLAVQNRWVSLLTRRGGLVVLAAAEDPVS